MSVNSSSASNYPLLCTNEVNLYIYFIVTALRVLLLLPLSTLVLYLGHQSWRQQRSSKPATHSDIFTYHMAAMELTYVLGTFFYFGGVYINQLVMMTAGQFKISMSFCGEILLHLVTCVERYLAVVHPITYMGLKNGRGVRIRNICIGCVWLLSSGIAAVLSLHLADISTIPLICLLVPCIIVMSFCSLSVLCVLIRPVPGKGGGEKEQVDQSKQRAFYIITAITVALWLWSVGLLVALTVNTSPHLRNSVGCLVSVNVNWLNLPSSLVSPLLYLHRAGKLSWCCRNNE